MLVPGFAAFIIRPLAVRPKPTCTLVLLIMLGASSNVYGQAAGGGATITGRVVDFHNQPVFTQVRLLAMGDLPASTVYTDSDGHFNFLDLPTGQYYVEVETKGYQPFRQAVSVELPPTGIFKVNVILDPVRQESKPAGPTVTGSPGTYRVDSKSPSHPFSQKALDAFAEGNNHRDSGDLQAALKSYKQALKAEPGFYPALNNQGAIYLRQGKHADAETAFEEALKLNSDDGEAYINLGHLSYEEGKLSDAVDWLEKGLKRSPQSAAGSFFLGSTYYRMGDFSQAESRLKTAYDLDSIHMSPALLQLANVSLKRHDSRQAANYLRLYMKANPNDPQVSAIKKTLANLDAD